MLKARAKAAFVEYASTNASIDWDTGLEKLRNPTFYYEREPKP